MEYGLVLSGGGTKGSFEIGVWKALRQLNIDITAVSGTSVGAINGAIIAQNDFEWAIDFWTNLQINQVFDLNKLIADKYVNEWSKISFKSFSTAFKEFLFEGGLDITPLRNNLNKYISEEAIRKSKIKLGLVTFSLTELKPVQLMIEQIPQGKLVDYLLASAAFPTFKTLEIDGKRFIDGGVYDNLPVNLLASQGYKKLITVELPAPGLKSKLKYKDIEIIQVDNSEHLGLIFDFNPDVIKRNIQLGYLDTLKKFDKVKGHTYYIDLESDDKLLNKFSEKLGSFLKSESGMKLPLLLGVDTVLSKSELLEEINKHLGYTKYKGSDLPLSLLEITAANLEVERLVIYTPTQLIKEIFNTVNRLLKENLEVIKKSESIVEIFKNTDELSVKPFTNIRFMSYYLYFLSLNADSTNLLNKLINRFSPETTLSIITLLYLTEM